MFKALKHRLIRHRAKIEQLPTSRYSIRLARTTADYEKAFNLVQVSYAYLGIEELGKDLFRMTPQHVLPEAKVLLAWEGDRVVGTVTVTMDSPAGLPLDKDFPELLSPLRKLGAKLSEVGSFAVVKNSRHTGVSLLLSVAATRVANQGGSTHTLIGVHPKAAIIFEALWGYKRCGDAKSHASLDADVTPLIATQDYLKNHCRRYGVHKESGRSIVDLAFGEQELPNTDLLPTSTKKLDHGMSRRTFQDLFVERSSHLAQLDPRTLAYVRSLRSEETLGEFTTRTPVEAPRTDARDLN